MELFEQQWASYRAVVDRDLMEHGPLAEATAAVLEGWLAQRPAGAAPPQLVDLGCGDLARLAPLLQRLPLASYTGLDLTAAVLPLAERALGPVPYPSRWLEGDLLAWATNNAPQAADEGPVDLLHSVDILHSAFAIHHLTEAEKFTFLQAARRRISPTGVFLWADVFRDPGEGLDAYRQRYVARIRRGWGVLSAVQQDQVISHLSSFDRPADRATIETAARTAGWHWRWAWRGAHNAEALAVLTPAASP